MGWVAVLNAATVPKRSRKVQHFVYSYFELRTLATTPGSPNLIISTDCRAE